MEPLETDEVEDDTSFDPSLPPLDRRILNIIKSCPNYTIRPARLASELGLSVNDACAELCGLLSAVGGGENGASFCFEKVDNAANTPPTMAFTFPPDFERRALRNRRKQDLWSTIKGSGEIALKVLKIVTAFGLILSLLILTIAGMVGLVAAVIAMSRGGGHNQHRSEAMRRLRSLFFTLRQLLWCYAVFGSNFEGQDPFLREIAMDLALFTSVCCGNPGSLFFWLRASQLSRRRRRFQRGWGGRQGFSLSSMINDEGVALIRRGTWGDSAEAVEEDRGSYRGLLSVAVEFLFGPTPFYSGPSVADRWRIRGAAVVRLSSTGPKGVSLEQLSPFVENPPTSLDDVAGVVSGGLSIVAHFNGVPVKNKESLDIEATKARFVFPELLSESSVATEFEDSPHMRDGSWEALLYSKDVLMSHNWGSEDTSSILYERRNVLTRLEPKQFLHCIGLGVLNAIGIVFFRQSLEPGGVLHVRSSGSLAMVIKQGLVPVLQFYSVLFFFLPAARLLVVLVSNAFLERRNQRRLLLVKTLSRRSEEAPSSSTTET